HEQLWRLLLAVDDHRTRHLVPRAKETNPLQLDHMGLTAKQRMHGVHAELSDLLLGGHRCECHKRFELSVTEKERHALLAPFPQPNGRRRLRVARSRRMRRRWSDDQMICDEEQG